MRTVAVDADEEQKLRIGEAAAPKGGLGSLGSVILLLSIAWLAFLALQPLRDNSFMTHLATGRLIFDDRSVPSADVYSFTARGEPWTVQSWLASLGYAAAERLGGEVAIRLLVLFVFVLAGVLLWRLSAPATSVFSRIAVLFPALLIATDAWSARPYMMGVIGLALIWLGLDGRLHAALLVPITWVWTNIHGSFLLGLVLVLAVLGGSVLDQRSSRGLRVRTELRVLGAVVFGSLLAVLSPVGAELLMFPIRGLVESQKFASIVEWQAPEFTSVADRAFLLFAMFGVGAVVRSGRWRHVLPFVVFLGAALLARRNIVMAVVVLLPCVSAGAPTLGSLRVATRPRFGPVMAAVCVGLVGAIIATGVAHRGVALDGYPQHALAYLESSGYGSGTVVSQDFVGNLLHALDGNEADVFFDDRRDMYPADVRADYDALNAAQQNWHDVLAAWDTDVLVWERFHPLGSLVAADRRWQVVYSDSRWVIACDRHGGCRLA